MSYRQGNNPSATSGADWQYSGAQVDPTTNDQTATGQYGNIGQTTQSTQSTQQPQGGYGTQSNATGQQYGAGQQQYGDAQQTSDFGSTGQTQSGYGQPQSQQYGQDTTQQYGQDTSQQYGQPQSQQYGQDTTQQYGQDASQQYGQPQGQSYGQHNPSFGEKVKGNFEKVAGQLQGDAQKAAQGEARAKGLDPSLQ